MPIVGRFLFGAYVVFLLLAAILIGASIGGFWGDTPMIISAILVLVGWITVAVLMIFAIRIAAAMAGGGGNSRDGLRWATRLFLVITILSGVTGLGLGFLSFVGCGPLYLPNLYHWVGMAGTI